MSCVCPDCGKSLSRLDSLVRHRKRVHGIQSRHYCKKPECAKHHGFNLMDNLRRHMKITHGISMQAYPSQADGDHADASSGQPNTGKHLSSAGPAGSDDLEYADRQELIRRLRAKTDECDTLQQQCRVLRLERDEYAEALGISEELRKKPEPGNR